MAKTKENPEEVLPFEEQEFSYDLKVPEERVAVLIGEKGAVKKEIEAATKTKLNISKEGDVNLLGKDAVLLFTAREMVQAIGRGFNPQIALLLLKANYSLEIMNLKDYAGKNQNNQLRLKGRVIGEGGRARKEIERLTDTHLSVYGKTVAVIGETDNLTNAHHALAMLLQGSKHASVYAFLERKKRERMEVN